MGARKIAIASDPLDRAEGHLGARGGAPARTRASSESHRGAFRVEEGRGAHSYSMTRSVGRTSSATPGAGVVPPAGSTAVGVTPGDVTIGIGAGTASFP